MGGKPLPVLRAIVIAELALLACVAPAQNAFANDTLAVLAAGGLQFVKTDELRMEEEKLVLSPREVAVFYQFRNLTNRDVKTTVAFPLPDIDMAEMSETPHTFHASPNEGDVVNFRVKAGGQAIAPRFEAHATTPEGKDVTALLKTYGVPLVDTSVGEGSEVWRAIEKLDKAAVAELEKAGALAPDELHHPGWTVKAAYHWEQTFPASAVLEVEHRYEPVLGGSEVAVADFQKPTEFTKPWCPDKSLAQAVLKLPRFEEGGTYVRGAWLSYVLTTGELGGADWPLQAGDRKRRRRLRLVLSHSRSKPAPRRPVFRR